MLLMARTHHRKRRGLPTHRRKKGSSRFVLTIMCVFCLCFAFFQECSKEDPAQTLHVVLRDDKALIESLKVSAVEALRGLGIRPEWISLSRPRRTDSPGAAARIKVRVPANTPLALCNLEVTRAVQYAGGAVMGAEEDGQGTTLDMAIGMKDSTTCTIMLSKDYSLSRPEGKVAIIIDGLGQEMDAVCRGFLSFEQPLTMAVLPHLKASREVADAAYARGFEVMLCLPMESHDSDIDPGRKAILSSLSSGEVGKRVREALGSVPHIKGVSNYMGSRITEDEVIMDLILSEIKEKNLFWIDSMSSLRSVAYERARAGGIRAGRSRLALDIGSDNETIEARLGQICELATTEGPVIAIAHGHPSTLQVLQEAIPRLERRGITLVHASEVVE